MADVKISNLANLAAAANDDELVIVDVNAGVTKKIEALDLVNTAHTHDGETLQIDGINSNGGAFPFTTSGKVTLSQQLGVPTIDLTGGQITFPAAAVPSANVNTLDDYQEYVAAVTACTGALTTAVSWKIVKIGSQVTLHLPITLGAGAVSAFFLYGVALPVEFRPAANTSFLTAIRDNNAPLPAPGIIFVASGNGNISIYKDILTTANFTITAQCGLQYATAVSWMV